MALVAIAVPTLAYFDKPAAKVAAQSDGKGMAVAYPWVFKDGNVTSRSFAIDTAQGIARKAEYASISGDVAASTWARCGLPTPHYGRLPSRAALETFGKALKAKVILYGEVVWNTRSIWVDLGPKTISTATVTVHVFDVASGKVIYTKKGSQGRSDEKENGYAVAADVLFTPVVSVISGGPATPREQRAVQIALAKGFHHWARP